MADINSWLSRIDAVQSRLAKLATPLRGLTEADPATGEQWEAAQVWGHLAEFIQFWIEQAGDVIDQYTGDPVPYGRLKTDPTRLAAVEQGRHTPLDLLWEEVRSDLADLREFLQALPEDWSKAVGLHPKHGELTVEQIIDDHIVSHLEEHADQLEELANKVETR